MIVPFGSERIFDDTPDESPVEEYGVGAPAATIFFHFFALHGDFISSQVEKSPLLVAPFYDYNEHGGSSQ
jgi:hypothetical protein